jgi:AraC-like DNA-binding protein
VTLKPFSSIGNLQGSQDFEQLFVDLEKVLGVTITVHDRAAIFRDTSGQSLIPLSRRMHYHSLCRLGRETGNAWDKNCLNHCRHAVNQEALKRKAPFQHFCWKGGHEIVVPLIKDNLRLGLLFAGMFRPAHQKLSSKLAKNKKLAAIHQKLATLSPDRINTITQILQTFGQGLIQQLDQLHQLNKSDKDRKTEIRRFFYYRAQDAISLQDLAKTLFLSPSRTSHLVQELFSISFKDMLIQERISRGKMLLVSTNLSAGEIARRIGIPNEYHFNRLFKKKVGVPPGEFRKKKISVD